MARLTVIINNEKLVFPVSLTKITETNREISIVSKTVTLEEHNFCREPFFYAEKFTKEERGRAKCINFTIFENSASVLDRLGQKKSI